MTNAGWRSPITVAATGTYRKDPAQNQDAHLVLDAVHHGFGAVVVADGIGSWERSGEAARAACAAAGRMLLERGPWAVVDAFDAAREAVLDLGEPSEEDRAGTTLLVVSTPDPEHILTGHIGNGALIQATLIPGAETRSAPDDGPAAMHWLNLLMPHAAIEHGRSTLSRALTTATRHVVRPALSWQSVDAPMAMLAVTDGIWSEDQTAVGRTGDGNRWLQLPPVLLRTLGTTEQILRSADVPDRTNVTPSAMLESLLAGFEADRLLDDDATVGLVIV